MVDLIREGFSPNRDKFHDGEYVPIVRGMAARIIEIEGLIFEDYLIARITGAHGFGRVGGQIRSTISSAIDKRFPFSIEKDGDSERKMYRPENSDRKTHPKFRSAPRNIRDHSDIPIVERAGLARRRFNTGLDYEETIRRMAEAFDLGKLRASTRARFQAAIKIRSDREMLSMAVAESTRGARYQIQSFVAFARRLGSLKKDWQSPA